jgi:hypothetical protein
MRLFKILFPNEEEQTETTCEELKGAFDSVEEATEQLISELAASYDSYEDQNGFIHRISDGIDCVYAKFCRDEQEVVSSLESLLDEEEYELPEDTKRSVEECLWQRSVL